MPKSLGTREAAMLAYAQMRQWRTARTGDLVGPLQITPQQERELLARMNRKGLIAQVRRGLYLLPERLPLGGRWSPSEALALNTLMADQDARYQITGPNAFNRYGLDEQTPAGLTVYNTALSGRRTIGPVSLALVRVAEDRLGDTEQADTPDGPLIYSSLPRTLMDAVYDWSRFDTLPRAYEWIEQVLQAGRIRVEDLVATTARFGNQGTARRIGAWLQHLGASPAKLTPLQRMLRSSTSLVPFIPDRPRRGRIDRQWGVILNDQE
jgi:predicted transcriptional regulator of viral defense system